MYSRYVLLRTPTTVLFRNNRTFCFGISNFEFEIFKFVFECSSEGGMRVPGLTVNTVKTSISVFKIPQ